MKKISMAELLDLIEKDEALTAKAQAFGAGYDGKEADAAERKARIGAFAAELGYELEPEDMEPIDDSALESVAGGVRVPISGACTSGQGHWVYMTGVSRPGKIFGDLWPDWQFMCRNCGGTGWSNFRDGA